jgi:type II secretory pathway component GspD/PulD (secretin)
MKTRHLVAILLATFTAARLATAQEEAPGAPPNPPPPPGAEDTTNAPATNAPPEQPAPAPAEASQPADTTVATNGLLLNFHDVPLSAVLNYLSAKAGLIIVSDVNLQGNVSVVAKQPVTTNEIVTLLNDQLGKNNFGAILQGRTLHIMDAERLKTYALTPVHVATNVTGIPINDEIVTEILPLRTLSAVQLLKDLNELIPRTATVSANEAGNAIIMTAQQKDVHRIDEIVNDLDGTAFSDVEVSILKYADSKAVASELKEIFQSADSDVTRANTRNTAFRTRGGGGGFMGMMMGGGGAPGGGGGTNPENNVQTHAVFVSDDQMNAVISAAPPDYMRHITNVIFLLDQPNQEVTMVRLFHLKHADPGEVADELTAVFPSPTTSDQNARTMGMRFMPPWMQPQSSANNMSARMKQQTTVLVQPDRRTESVIVTASRDMMEQIAEVIKGLDEGNEGIQEVTAMPIGGADPATVQQALSVLFYSANKPPTSSTATTSVLASRATANQNSQASAVQTTTTGGMGSTGTTGIR